MTEIEFRKLHSELIGYYQLIEWRLRVICSLLLANEEKSWLDFLDDYETDPLGKMLQELPSLQKEKQLTLFSESDFAELNVLREKRNYWVHQCFIDPYHHISFRRNGATTEIKHLDHAKMIKEDWDTANKWDVQLTEISRSIQSN